MSGTNPDSGSNGAGLLGRVFLLSHRVDDPPERRATSVRLNALMLIVMAMLLLGALNDVLARRWSGVLLFSTVLVLFGGLRWAALASRSLRTMELFSHAGGVVVLAALTWRILHTGQHAAIGNWLLLPLPVFAAYQHGLRAALGWYLAVVAVIVGVHLSERFVVLVPQRQYGPGDFLLWRLVLLTALSALSMASRRVYDRQVAILEARERQIRQQSEALARARDEALATVAVRSQFVANMSHEIRTPLAGLMGVADLLVTEPLSARQRELVALVKSSGETLLTIVNDVLDLSKLEAGAMRLEQRPFEPRTVAAQVASLFAPAAERKGLRIDVVTEAAVPAWLLGDAMRIRQVLQNLVGNAVKFTSVGGVTLSVGPYRDGALSLSVRDTGPGIDEADRERLFLPFEQLDTSHARRHGGTGLGLPISAGLVKLLGGSLSVDSLAGCGATFHFSIPCAVTDGETSAPRPALALDPTLATRHPLRILVAEDNPLNRRLIEDVLAGLGYRPVVVDGGQRAIDVAAAQEFDLVLMDVQMPGVDGIAATAAIRRQMHETHETRGTHQRPPRILALTASVMADQRRRLLDGGIDDIIAKPFRPAEIVAALVETHQRLGQASSAPSIPRTAGPVVPVEAAVSSSRGALLDERRIQELRALYPTAESLRSLVDTQRVDAERLLADAARAVAQGDARLLERSAHSLKSTSALLGALRLSTLCARLEQLARESAGVPDAGSAGALLEEIRAESELATSALARLAAS